MKVVCYGDSNTFGYDPRSYIGERYAVNARWVDILAEKTGWEIRNNGMNGREIPCREIVFPKSTDILFVMLGTNDLLQGNCPEIVAERMENFLSRLTIEKKRIVLIAPPPMQFGEWVSSQKLIDASVLLAEKYQRLAERMNIWFVDGSQWDISLAYDGVHFTEEGHMEFANSLYHWLKTVSNWNDSVE